MDDRPVQREELDGVSLEGELMKVARASAVGALEASHAHARLHIAELTGLAVHYPEHQRAPALVGRDDRGLAEGDAHARAREPRDEQAKGYHERDGPNERLEVGEPVRSRPVRVNLARAGGGEDADAVRERLQKRVGHSHHIRTAQRAVAEGAVLSLI